MFNYNNQNYPMNNKQNENNAPMGSLNEFETLQNARKDLVGEIDAIIQYDDHYHKTDNALAKATWENIRNEEMVHVGELLGLIGYLAPYQKEYVERGLNEFKERVQKELK